MRLLDLVSHPHVQLPLRRSTNDYQSFVNGTLDTYVELLSTLSEEEPVGASCRQELGRVTALATGVKNAVAAFLRGQPVEAHARLSEALKDMLDQLKNIEVSSLAVNDMGYLYRVRKTTSPDLKKEELFHIPFDQRHKVATQRYSIPGLPCLYLSGSLYVCWAEMGRPSFSEIQASAFWLKPHKHVRVINFSNRPVRLLKYFQPGGPLAHDRRIETMVASHLTLWPLIAMCSVITLHRDASFKPEYIVPQLLLQWITKEHDFDGVCYFSTHVPQVTNHPIKTSNFVFPVKSVKGEGRCQFLRELFGMTDPKPWQLLRAVTLAGQIRPIDVPEGHFEFIEGVEEAYAGSDFGDVEMKLNRLAQITMQRVRDGDVLAGTVKE
jgi:hypothetical protein